MHAKGVHAATCQSINYTSVCTCLQLFNWPYLLVG